MEFSITKVLQEKIASLCFKRLNLLSAFGFVHGIISERYF